MANTELYVHVVCPTVDDGGTGHYDIFFNRDVNLKMFTKNNTDLVMTRPVVSYGGSVIIGPLSTYATGENTDYFRWRFSVEDSKVEAFFNYLKSVASNITFADGKIKFKPTTSFKDYDINSRNCFTAAAIWMNLMGIDTLSKIVDEAKYNRYAPW